MDARGGGYSLYGEASPEKDTFFMLQVYERVGKSVIWVSERAQKG